MQIFYLRKDCSMDNWVKNYKRWSNNFTLLKIFYFEFKMDKLHYSISKNQSALMRLFLDRLFSIKKNRLK